jgi:hypothetical protein
MVDHIVGLQRQRGAQVYRRCRRRFCQRFQSRHLDQLGKSDRLMYNIPVGS